MENLELEIMTLDLCHQLFKNFHNDPMTFINDDYKEYEYKEDHVNQYYEQLIASKDKVEFVIMYNKIPVGNLKL